MNYPNVTSYERYDAGRIWLEAQSAPESRSWMSGTSTSSYYHPQVPSERLVCTNVLLGLQFTNAAAPVEPLGNVSFLEKCFSQITSASTRYLKAIASISDDSKKVVHSSSEAIGRVRLLTGLTWEQVARLFGVSRRTVHLWASGSAMSSDHEEHLHRLLSVIDGSSLNDASASGASLLFVSNASGHCAFDLLCNRCYDDAARELGPASRGRRPLSVPRQLPDARVFEQRKPLSPTILVSAQQSEGPPVDRPIRRLAARKVKREL